MNHVLTKNDLKALVFLLQQISLYVFLQISSNYLQLSNPDNPIFACFIASFIAYTMFKAAAIRKGYYENSLSQTTIIERPIPCDKN